MRHVALFALAATLCLGCHPKAGPPARSPTEVARENGPFSRDGEVVGRWLLAELVAPGGTPEGVAKARARLDELGTKGMYASLARGLDDASHGRLNAAAREYLDASKAARGSSDPLAQAVAWYAVNHLTTLDGSVPNLWRDAKPWVVESVESPGSLGWRARAELVEWWSRHAFEDAEADLFERTAALHGCAREVRLAGPFGHAVPADRWRSFPAEKPGPWPAVFPVDPLRAHPPHVLKSERHGCSIRADEPVENGIFYAETYVDVPATRDLIVAIQGAYAIWIDDHEVLSRDLRQWGVWPHFGVHVRLEEGRHRVLARIEGGETSVRFLRSDGTPADVSTNAAWAGSYPADGPKEAADPNVLDRYVANGKPVPPRDEVEAFVAGYLAAVEGQYDLANVLIEPLLQDQDRAAALTLSTSASFAEKDPIFPETEARDLGRILRQRAVEKDPKLYFPRVWLVADRAEKDLPGAATELRAMASEFPEVPDILRVLGNLYARLGWRAERVRTVLDLVQRFPDDRGALEAAIPIDEELGRLKDADGLAARLKELYPDSEIDLDRALARKDYDAAIAELRRLAKRRPDRRDIADRVADVLTRAGKNPDPLPMLERALRRNPRDSQARLAVADARFAAGDKSALRTALAAAIQQGAREAEIRNAIELVEGATELEPYRIDARDVIEQYERDPEPLEGTAARVLDYSALWIHEDGTSRMLEHELIRVQSQEAIGKLAEQRTPPGALVLKLRVLKKNGTILEPERVEGKPTVTMPHLEVGDYIETENITTQDSDGEGGKRYLSPTWFFREADIAYWRSEFVVIAPTRRELVIETTGKVPAPQVSTLGPLTVRRWRVDRSAAAPVEPNSVPIQEFLPSVRCGWGITAEGQIARLADATVDDLPRDPRLVRIAERVVGDAKPDDVRERARRVYRWIVANVEDGREGDGRRVVIGKSGNRAAGFLYLARALGLPIEIATTQDRLRPKDEGPIASALAFDHLVFRLEIPGGAPLWFTVGDKYAPFGFLPAELRGVPAVRLVPGFPRETTPTSGSTDGIVYEGTVELRSDGSATLDLAQRFVGRLAIGVRSSVEQLPEEQLRSVVESRLLARALPGARLVKLDVVDKDDLDKPLTLKMRVEMSDFARRRGGSLALKPPLMMKVAALAALDSRQTPMLLPEATHSEVHLVIRLPQGAKVTTPVHTEEIRDADRSMTIADRTSAGVLSLDRVLDIPAGRVPVDAYPAFRTFTERADEATGREILIEAP